MDKVYSTPQACHYTTLRDIENLYFIQSGPIPYQPQTYRPQSMTISATRYTRLVLSYGAFVCILVVPGARCSARLSRKESALKSVEECVVAVMVVTDMVCGRYGLWPIWSNPFRVEML